MTALPQAKNDPDAEAFELWRTLERDGFEGNHGIVVEFARRLRERYGPETVRLAAENVALRERVVQQSGQTQYCPMCEDYARKIEVARDALDKIKWHRSLGGSPTKYQYEVEVIADNALAILSPNASVKEEVKQHCTPLVTCDADDDGYCDHPECPQLRDGEPVKTHRHCPLDLDREDY